MAPRRTLITLRWLSGVALLATCVTPARAAIDMSGVYVAVESPCRYTFVHTGTSLTVSGCGAQNVPLNLTGTIDSDTGVFTVTGTSSRCAPTCPSVARPTAR